MTSCASAGSCLAHRFRPPKIEPKIPRTTSRPTELPIGRVDCDDGGASEDEPSLHRDATSARKGIQLPHIPCAASHLSSRDCEPQRIAAGICSLVAACAMR